MGIGRLALKASIGLAGAAVSYWGGLYLTQRALVFRPINEFPEQGSSIPTNAAPAADVRDKVLVDHFWMLSSIDACKLEAICIKPREPWTDAIVYYGGRMEDIRWLSALASHCPHLAIYAHNYREFGQSEGKADETNIVDDAIQLFDHVSQYSGARRVHVVGRSLGTGVAIQVVAKRETAGSLSLISPYDSIVNIARKKFPLAPVSTLLSQRFESHQYVGNLSLPVQIILASNDKVIPHRNTKKLMESFSQPVKAHIVPATNHSTVATDQRTWEQISVFIAETEAEPVLELLG
jgi:pimeloyl-ACP methyl ester carboxylesterase